MAEDVQRALDNLRFDRMVKAFCIISPDNVVYQSRLDSDTEAMVKQTVSLYKGQISQLTVNTEAGLVVISKIVNNWLLAVLFPPNLSLGIAVVKTKATLLALRELDLDILKTMPAAPVEPKPAPPPQITTPTPAPSPQVTPPPETKTEPPPTPPPTPPPATPSEPIITPEPTHSIVDEDALPPPLEPPQVEPIEPPPPTPSPPPTLPESRIDLTFVPEGGDALLAALDKGSPVGGNLYDKFGPFARDILFLVDGKRNVKTIAFLLGLPEYAIVEVLEFAINNNILAKPAAT
jgi:predicted regulator of Ras-like GTPase activity (Roadblock/LC7/MglB family)